MAWNLSAFSDEAGPSCEAQIAGLKEAGFNFIDIRGMDGFNITVLPVEKAKEIKGKLDAAGITVNMYGSPLGKIDLADDFKIDMDKLRHLGLLKPILGASGVRIFSYYNRKAQKPVAEFHKEALGRLTELAKLAGDLGLVLYHENEGEIFGEKAKDVLTITQELRQKFGAGKGAFRMIFDFGNYNAAKEDVWENWVLLRETTDAIHLKDNKSEGKDMFHVPVGQGGGQVEKILRDAVDRGWEGPLVVEPHLQHSPAVAVTGPGGVANVAFSKMSANESFQVACAAAKALCAKVGAKVA